MICTSERRLLTFGNGEDGQLGHGGYANERIPRMLKDLMGVKVAEVAAGFAHTVICTAERVVYGPQGVGNSATVVALMR